MPRTFCGAAGSNGSTAPTATDTETLVKAEPSTNELLRSILEQLRANTSGIKKVQKSLSRLENRLNDLYEYTSSPSIAQQFGSDFVDSMDFSSAAAVTDYLTQLAYKLDAGTLKQRPQLIQALEDLVLKDRQGLKAAMKALYNEACEEGGCSMLALPRDFAKARWSHIRTCLSEIQASMVGSTGSMERFANLHRLIDVLETGAPPRPLPGWMEMATAMSSGQCIGQIELDCKGRIDVRDTYIEFHFGAFKSTNEGLPQTCAHLTHAAALFSWAYKVLEPQVHSGTPRDVEAVGYCFSVGTSRPTNEPLKMYNDYTFDLGDRRTEADISFKYFVVKPTGLQERFAKD